MARAKAPRVSLNPYKGAGKVAKTVVNPDLLRIPKVAPVPAIVNERKVRFRFNLVDHEKWSLLDITREDHSDLLRLMAQVEEMEAGELFKHGQKMCKTYTDMSACPNPDTLKRLAENFEALDHMVRLELDGLRRLYGARVGHEFLVIWWDPSHEVWPSQLRNT